MMNHRMKRFIGLLAFGMLPLGVTAAPMDDGKLFAQQMNASTVEGMAATVDPQTVPNFTATPPETAHYNEGLNIENVAETAAQSDTTAQFVREGRLNRPQITIDRETDPLFERFDTVTTEAHTLTETYTGCVNLPVGDIAAETTHADSCLIDGMQDTILYSCQRTLHATCSNSDAGNLDPFRASDFTTTGAGGFGLSVAGNSFRWGSGGNNRGRGVHTNTITFAIAAVETLTNFEITRLYWDDWLDVTVNGTLVFRAIGWHVGLTLTSTRYEWGGVYGGVQSIDLRPYLHAGINTITVQNVVGGSGNAYMEINAVKIIPCAVVTSYSWTCPDGETTSGGTYLGEVCTSGPETRTIMTAPVYQSCWEWNENYSRLSEPYYVKQPACAALEAAGCGQTTTECLLDAGLFCASQVAHYTCPNSTSTRTVSLCGSSLICPDGDCTSDIGQDYVPATSDFQAAATGLAVAGEIASGFDENTMTVFNGNSESCDERVLSFYNCCADSGWALDLNLASCSTAEQILGMKKEAEQTHYIGEYCSDDSIFGCLRYTKVYCTYPSKLSRIIVEQGKAQMSLGFGNAENPVCTGFTTTELEGLDFNVMDFSEFYSDVAAGAANATTPSSSSATTQIQQSIEARYPEIQQ